MLRAFQQGLSLDDMGVLEIGELTDSLRITVKQLKKHVDYISGIAYIDGLTGVKNHLAYVRDIDELKSRLLYEEMEFSIVVMDLNGLKQINDTYGHDIGNELIKFLRTTFRR